MWIKTKDQLPPARTTVLIKDSEGYVHIGYYFAIGNNVEWFMPSARYVPIDDSGIPIVEWHEIPE
jgi:hypothetical protein